MAYIVGGKSIMHTQYSGSGSTITFPVTPGHEVGDVVYIIVHNTSAAGSAMTCSGSYNSKGVTSVVSSVSRTQVFWKYATSTSEADVTITGQNADFTVEVVLIRGCDQTDPFDTFGNTDFTTNAINQTTGTLTTTTDNCLIFTSIFLRGGSKQLPDPTSDMGNFVPINKYFNNSLTNMLSGYRIKRTAGTTTAVKTINSASSSTTGRAFQAAFKDANPSSPTLPPEFSANYEVVKLHMGTTGASSATDSFSRNETTTWNSITNMTPTTINGLTVVSTTATVAGSGFTTAEADYGFSTNIGITTSGVDATGRWTGVSHTVSSVDMTNKAFAITFGMNSVVATDVGEKGCIIVFEDGSGNWAAFQLSKRQGLFGNYPNTKFIFPGTTTPLDSSGTMDWTDVAKIGYCYHRVNNSGLSRSLMIRMAVLISEPIVYGGSSAAPINAEFVGRMMTYWGGYGLANAQGSGQIITKSNFTYGNGSTESYIDLSLDSNEQPRLPDGSFENQFWQGAVDVLRTRYNLSSNDTLKLGALISPINQTLDHTGSTPASFDAKGKQYVKQSGELINGVTYERTSFSQCGQIDLNGASLNTCAVSNSTSSAAVLTNDPSDISGTSFTSAGTGYAVKIKNGTPAGSYNYYGNTHTGYGADNTTNAAINNDSGNAITLVLQAGDTPPTVNNTNGSTTAFDVPAVSVEVKDYIAGSRVRYYNTTQATEVYNDTPSGTTFAFVNAGEFDDGDSVNIRVTKKGKLLFERNEIFSDANGISLTVSQPEDTTYTEYAVDGATVTTIDWNGTNDTFEFDEPTSWSAKRLYNWYNYYCTTATGIAEVFGLITVSDIANLYFGDVKFDNLNSYNLPREDDIQTVRTDDTDIVANPTTGGGGFNILDDRVYVKNINTATNVVTGTEGNIITAINALNDLSSADVTAAVPTANQNADATWNNANGKAIKAFILKILTKVGL